MSEEKKVKHEVPLPVEDPVAEGIIVFDVDEPVIVESKDKEE